jgi:WD40 repeat protein
VRTGQSHRTLLGHTGPITCLQFDEIQIASGSLDKTLKVKLPCIKSDELNLILSSQGVGSSYGEYL